MSLSLPPFRFANEVDNLTGTPGTSGGTNFTAGASNADSTAVTLLSALAFDVHFLYLSFGGLGSSAVDSACLADILIDPAGGTSWASLIDDLTIGFSPNPATSGISMACNYAFPLFIKSGASVGVRARTANASNITTPRVFIWAYGGPTRPDMWWCGQKVESLGPVPTTSKGVSVTPGNTGAAGSWTSVGSPTSARYGSIQLGLNGSDSTMLSVAYFWQIGISSAKIPGTPTLYCNANTAEHMGYSGFGQPIWCDIPAATQLQVMGTCSGTAEAHTVALYGVY